jgi:hypothetical protein
VKLLAIDPGNTQSAFVLYEPETETILSKGIVDNKELVESLETIDYDEAAIEMIASYGMPVGKEVFETCLWIGRFYQTIYNRMIQINLVYRKDVKLHLCQTIRGVKDSHIRQALLDRLGKEKTKGVKKDEWAALGVAVTFCGSIEKEPT